MAKVRFRQSSKNFLLNLYFRDGPLAHQSTWNQLGTYQEWFALVHLHHYSLLEFWEPRMGIEECQHIFDVTSKVISTRNERYKTSLFWRRG